MAGTVLVQGWIREILWVCAEEIQPCLVSKDSLMGNERQQNGRNGDRYRSFPLAIYGLLAAAVFGGNTQSFGAVSDSIRDDYVEAQIIVAAEAVAPGSTVEAGLRLTHDAHWHTYYQNPGDAGYPTSLVIEGADADLVAASEFRWPDPQTLSFEGLVTYGYEGEVILPFTLTIAEDAEPGSTLALEIFVEWLMCEEICIPGSATLSLSLPVAAEASAAPAETETLAEARDRIPAPLPEPLTAWNEGEFLTLSLPGDLAAYREFLPDASLVEASTPQRRLALDDEARVTAKVGAWAEVPAEFSGILRAGGDGNSAVRFAAVVEVGPPPTEVVTDFSFGDLLLALGGGFLGGLILNLMPCVFPVLGLKAMGLVQQAGSDRKKVVEHGLIFTAGVVLSFWVLAGLLLILRGAGEELGWGFQLQVPGFNFVIAALMLVIGLNLSGVFEIGAGLTGAGSRLSTQQGRSGSFFTGVLATIVATPCSAPILASALGAALVLPAAAALGIFTMIALGLATPYLMLSLFPALATKLPKPGPWMETFKQVMAFPLYGFAGYLVWVLMAQVGEAQQLNVILALVLVGLACWVYGRYQMRRRATTRRLAAVAAAVLLLSSLWWAWPRQPEPDALVWETWSPEAIEAGLQEGRPVYVDFTARWCTTCQVNKRVVFGSDRVKETIREQDVLLLKADWSNRGPKIANELQKFGRAAVPLNLIYLPGEDAPVILSEVLTPDEVLQHFEGQTATAAL
jgi:thiol:disulfide interchange protein DsbD